MSKWIASEHLAAFTTHLATLAPADGVLEDLEIAFGAAHGHREAQRHVDQTVRDSRQNVARIDADPGFLDEVHQLTLERLLSTERPRLIEYAGLGPLGAWIRATAVRVALDLRRQTSRETPHEDLEAVVRVAHSDSTIRGLTAKQVSGAIRTSLDKLSSRDRTLLRLHYFEGTTLDALARMYAVHRATVARWLAEARAVVLEQTRQTLMTSIGGDELADALGSIQSQLDVSFRQVFEGHSEKDT